jgi:hypothetical protein
MASNIKNNQARMYSGRQWFYGGLLVFVVVVGLPIIGVPSLRDRLSERIMAIKASLQTDSIAPVTVAAANNSNPFPAEFEKTVREMKPPVFAPLERIFTLKYRNSKPMQGRIVDGSRRDLNPEPAAEAANKNKGAQEFGSIIEDSSAENSNASAGAPDAVASVSENEAPKYQKGPMEQSAYDLLLKANSTVADIIKGTHPGLHFKSWDAAKREGDTYWVRLKLQMDKNPEAEYIWTVKLQSKQVAPLNFNAKSIS